MRMQRSDPCRLPGKAGPENPGPKRQQMCSVSMSKPKTRASPEEWVAFMAYHFGARKRAEEEWVPPEVPGPSTSESSKMIE